MALSRSLTLALIAAAMVASSCGGPPSATSASDSAGTAPAGSARSSGDPGTSGASSAGPHDAPGRPNAVLVRVVDGDTIIAHIGGRDERVRLIGMNTPESVDPRRPVQCYGPEASHRMDALLPVGTKLRLERDAEPRDKYGRLLAYVYRASDGLFLDRAMVVDGYAVTLSIPPNTTFASTIASDAAAARAAGRGLWSACPDPGS